ncbi:MAG: hydroxymethylbilane synthase [Planctomycetes bacterium]|nr:hydroxymethylbilane synthase [Planctomycetota bacterium]
MTTLRVGTRGSDLALWQTRWVCSLLRQAHPSLYLEELTIKTHGDTATQQLFDADWPVGGFVGAIEQALVAKEIDFAVHSYKDLQTASTPGLTIAAVPPREVVYDVLVTKAAVDLDHLRPGFRLGTSSPRRAAQFRRLGDIEIVPIRGNVRTRIAKIEREDLDGVVLAAAGVKRLGIALPYTVNLPTDRFVPAPAQGAVAVQTCEGVQAQKLVEAIDDDVVRRAVTAELSFLKGINAGCHVPVGALATTQASSVSLHGQLFSDDGTRMVEGVETGNEPQSVGARLAERLLRELEAAS